jgi:pimeloyl-ACP methyl ester carboxylesterase
VRIPFLFVRGGASGVVGDEDVVELRRRVPTVRVEVVEGAGHSVQGDRPVELARLLDGFSAAS